MSVFLPIASLNISLPLLIGLGLLVGTLSGLLGVGGGFLQSPVLIMLGIPPTVATASGATAIIATSSSGTAAHFRLGHVDFKLGALIVPGGLLGAVIGVHLIRVLRLVGNADLLIIIAYLVLLGVVGSMMFVQSLRTQRRIPDPARVTRRRSQLFDRFPLQTTFARSGVRQPIYVPFLMGMLVGTLTAIMGVGGGFMMVPMMVYLLGMPVHVAVGTDLFQILITCSGVAMLQAEENHTLDIVLVLVLAAGSTIGAQLGAQLSRFVSGERLMLLLATLILLVFIKLLIGVMLPPDSLLEVTRLFPLARGALC